MTKKIPSARLLFFLIVFASLPLFFIVMRGFTQYIQLKELNFQITNTFAQIKTYENLDKKNQLIRKQYHQADSYFLNSTLENLDLLSNEQSNLKQLNDETSLSRLSLLKSNRLTFAENSLKSGLAMQESLEFLTHPVEVDLNDIKNILTKLEDRQIASFSPDPHQPHIIVKEFFLEKIKTFKNMEVFILDMKLLKREYYE